MKPEGGIEQTILGIEAALHQLCQPLTVLRCRLELGLLDGSQAAIRAALVHGLRECGRLDAVVTAMRELVQQGLESRVHEGEQRKMVKR